MAIKADFILSVLDLCCDVFTFPMLDNGYVYLAATRLALYRSQTDWAMVIEVFGYSPRAGIPDTHTHTFASCLQNRKTAEDYVSEKAFNDYLRNNPYNQYHSVYPIEEGPWIDDEDGDLVAANAKHVELRGRPRPLPTLDEYARHGIELEDKSSARVWELCRYLAALHRDEVLATADERRNNVPPELNQILQLEEWHHPNVVDDKDRPSGSETFQQLAQVLATGNVDLYRPSHAPNTHWKNWPDGGTL